MVKRAYAQSVQERENDFPRAAIDDLVPSGSYAAQYAPSLVEAQPHRIESDVRRRLAEHPNVKFTSLVVHRMEDGVCLEGVIETDGDELDVCGLAMQVPGVKRVINHLLVLAAECS